MHCIGCFVFQGQVGPVTVINFDRFVDHGAGLVQVPRLHQQELRLQDSINPLRQGVLVAVVAIGHRTADAMTSVQALVAIAAILNASVRMMNQWLVTGPLSQGLAQGLLHVLAA